METLEFTGGEPTIRRDLPELISYARKTVGFQKISIISNGFRLSDAVYSKELVDLGVSDFLFSVHGSKGEVHDQLTQVDGSFNRLLKAIENLKSLGAKVRCNSVVTAENYEDIYNRASLFRKLGVKTINFIIFNPLAQAATDNNFVSYSSAAERFRKSIDDFGSDFNKFTVRYIPLCLMDGYENHVQNVHQVHYDHDEWNYYQRAYVSEPHSKWYAGVAAGLALLPEKTFWAKIGWDHAKHAAILEAHSWLQKDKKDVCRDCSYRFICGGVWREYRKRFGSTEFKSHTGKLILEPWHFMTDSQRAENS